MTDNWPYPSFDARHWAEAFCAVCKEKGFDPIKDEDWVMGWFANALMRGYDQHVEETSHDLTHQNRPVMRQILEPILPLELEDHPDVDGEAGAREWTAKAISELARQLGVMNDYYYPLIGAARIIRASETK